ncbi:MAG: hypothetical protein V1816_22355 [Pseudomonadota bacterium]
MATARGETVVEGVEGYYHCVSRCVRRAFLCGCDPYTGRSFEHRKAWVQARLELLAAVFALEISAFAVMSNHVHVVVRTRPDLAAGWSREDAARRWLVLSSRRGDGDGRPSPPAGAEISALAGAEERIEEIRRRLGSVSWFMRCLNEPIARRANKEDGCKGRFWEGRFYCQALRDESAVLACMVYVDLNPVRAGAAESPEASFFTGAYLRLAAERARERLKVLDEGRDRLTPARQRAIAWDEEKASGDEWLSPLGPGGPGDGQGGLDLSLREYLALLDWTGRRLREGGPSVPPDGIAPIMARFYLDRDHWLLLTRNYGDMFHRAAGRAETLREEARRSGLRWLHGLVAGRKVFLSA